VVQYATTMKTVKVVFAFLKCAKQVKRAHWNYVKITMIVSPMLVLLKHSLVLPRMFAAQMAYVKKFTIGKFLRTPKAMMGTSVRARRLGKLVLIMTCVKVACVYLVSVKAQHNQLVQLVTTIWIAKVVFAFRRYVRQVGKVHLIHVKRTKIANLMLVVLNNSPDLHN